MKTRVNNQTKIADHDELTITLLFNNQTGQNCSYTGNRSRGTQQVKYFGNTDVFYFGVNFLSPKWTRTKLMIVITPSLQPNDAFCLYRGAIGSSAHILKFSLQSVLFLLSMTTGILFSTFQFAKSIFRVLRCEAVNYDKYHSACANGTSISDSWCTMYI